jgi:hypothetical protein
VQFRWSLESRRESGLSSLRSLIGRGSASLHTGLPLCAPRNSWPSWYVFIDKERGVVLVEFPHEAITGGNRLWVRSSDLIWPNGAKP